MNSAEQSLQYFLQKRQQDLSIRTLENKSHLIDFSSNDYLGLSRSALLQHKTVAFLKEHGMFQTGATGSRLISGNYVFTENVEQTIAAFHDAESALLFNSGYDANVGFFSSVPQKNDVILFDELVHASMRDGIKMSRANAISFTHNNLETLEKLLQQPCEGNKYVAVESIYSMDGDEAPLQNLVLLCEKYQAFLVVDEAHATGLYGTNGEGLVHYFHLQQKVFARIITYGKALGGHGAAILGNHIVKQFLVNFARSFIYTTALPFHSLAHIYCAYLLLPYQNKNREKLKKRISFFQDKVSKKLLLHNNNSAIQSIIIKGNENAKTLALQLEEKGIYCKAILYPTVPKGSERLRICIHAFNTLEEIELLAATINDYAHNLS